MVVLTVTPAAKKAIDEYCRDRPNEKDDDGQARRDKLCSAEVGDRIEHDELIQISRYLVQHRRGDDATAKQWRLDTLLKGANICHPAPPPKPEPSPEYKALMQRLREQEEQRQYERMINPLPQRETFSQRFPSAGTTFGSGAIIGSNIPDDVDEVTYADVNRQMILIINVLVSIIACSVAIWMAARRWSVPQRLALSFSGSTLVAFAEVAIYIGYLRRIREAKTTETKKIEQKEIFDTWVIDAKASSTKPETSDALRFRKGKHR